MTRRLQHCILCGSSTIFTYDDSVAVFVACRLCLALVRIELNPTDAPDVTGRIEILMEPKKRARGN